MWQIENLTPFASGQGWVRDLVGAETWLVVVKATFDILPDGTTKLSKDQPDVTRTPVYRDEPGRSSIIYDNDFVLAKRSTDIVINGTAYAPDNRPVGSFDAGFQVGSVRKVLRIMGNRTWNSDGRASSPEPCLSMPLIYEQAFGGVDESSPHPETDWYWPNPVGTGFVTSQARLGSSRPPNIEYPDQPVKDWKSRPKPAGFGVIGGNWAERAGFAGTYDDEWSKKRQPLLPMDFDIRHYQFVPDDQQTPAFLQGGESVTLANLTPSGKLHCSLPELEFFLETFFMDGERREHVPPLLHTVVLEPDFPRLSLIWHSAIECHAKVYRLCKTRIEVFNRRTTDSDGEEEGEVDDLLDLI